MPKRQQRIAASQLAKKLKLEAQFKPELMRFFNQLSRDINVVWAASQSIPSLQPFQTDLISLLRKHYRRVAKSFKTEVRKELKHNFLNLDHKADEVDDTVNNEVMAYILAHSIVQSRYIIDTTQNELQKIVAQAIMQNAAEETPLSNLQLGNQIKNKFVARSSGRVETIAVTETQNTAEIMKYIESESVNRALTGQRQIINTWNTTLDEKTRPSHVAADRQEVKQGQPYTVQGQLLRYPGDTALGATLDNVINCRCASIASVIGEPAPISLTPATPLISTGR